MKVTYPMSSVQVIVTDDVRRGFEIWCPGIVFEFHQLKLEHATIAVKCQSFGVGPYTRFKENPKWGLLDFKVVGDNRMITFSPKAINDVVGWEVSFPLFAELFAPMFAEVTAT